MKMFVISDAFWREFERQDVYEDIWDMVAAAPKGVRGIHIHMVEQPPKTAACQESLSDCHSFFPDVAPRTVPDIQPEFSDGVGDAIELEKNRSFRVQMVLAEYMDTHYPLSFDGETFLGPRFAVQLSELDVQAPAEVASKARKCSVKLKRVTQDPRRWTFAVDCGGETRAVKVRAVPRKSSRSFADCDVFLACSCPFWVYYGCEHHAKSQGYLDGQLRGDGSRPESRDPSGKNLLCKHTLAALSVVRRYPFEKGVG